MSIAAPAASRQACSLNGPSAILRRLAHSLALAMLGLLVLLAVLFLVRRLSGALVQPLGGAALVSVAVLLAAVVAGLRAAHTNPTRKRGTSVLEAAPRLRVGLVFAAVPALVAFVILAALTLPGSPALGIATAWFVLVAAEGATWLFLYRGRLHISIPA